MSKMPDLDPAIDAAAFYWKVQSDLNLKREALAAQFGALDLRKSAVVDAPEKAAMLEQGTSQDHGGALDAFLLARYDLCTTVPESLAGAIEMLKALRAEFCEPFANGGGEWKVLAYAGVLTMIENIQAGIERMETREPALKLSGEREVIMVECGYRAPEDKGNLQNA